MRKLSLLLLIALVACSKSTPVTLVAPPSSGCEATKSLGSDGQTHIQVGTTARYATDPPASGSHYPSTAPTGFYDKAIRTEFAVHNLEHGHVVIWFNDLDKASIAALKTFAASEPKWVIVSPRPTMTGVKVAFTAWTKVKRCAQAPADIAAEARTFFDANARHAPEKAEGRPLG